MTDNLASLIDDKLVSDVKPDVSDQEIIKDVDEFIKSNKGCTNIISDFAHVFVEDQTEENMKQTHEIIAPDSTSRLSSINLYDWFQTYVSSFDDITELELKVDGIKSSEILCVAILTNSGTLVDGHPERRIEFIKNVDGYNIFNLTPKRFLFFTNGLFQIVYLLGDNEYIISYGSKSGLINYYARKVEGIYVPLFKMPKMKRKAQDYVVYRFSDKILTDDILKENPNIESFYYRYKKLSDIEEPLSTKLDVIKWFDSKKLQMVDLNHWISIDELIIDILNIKSFLSLNCYE